MADQKVNTTGGFVNTGRGAVLVAVDPCECDCDCVCIQLGTDGSFVAPFTGRLYMGMNDDDFSDNDNVDKWDVTVAGEEYEVGNRDLVRGPCVLEGATISYSATGVIPVSSITASDVDADGLPNPFPDQPMDNFRCPELTPYSLIGRLCRAKCPEVEDEE